MSCRTASTASDMEPALGLDPGGLFANGNRVANLARARQLLAMPPPETKTDESGDEAEPQAFALPCPRCGGPMIIIETFERGALPRAPPQLGTGTL